MPKYTIDVDEETYRKLHYLKGLHGFHNISQSVILLAKNVNIPPRRG